MFLESYCDLVVYNPHGHSRYQIMVYTKDRERHGFAQVEGEALKRELQLCIAKLRNRGMDVEMQQVPTAVLQLDDSRDRFKQHGQQQQ